MKHKLLIFCVLLTLCVFCGKSQLITDFETDANIKSFSMYDCWEESPFRKGLLKGNCKIVDNPHTGVDEVTGKVQNGSSKVLGAQRSIHGSNMFGVKIDFKEPILLTTAKWFHIHMFRPVEGRVMLVGLGRRLDWDDQPEDVEQFWEFSVTDVMPNSWCDAVFLVWTSGNIALHSLIIIPECESPHAAEEDFLFYVDNISMTTSDKPTIEVPTRYPIAVSATKKNSDSNSYLRSIDFETPSGTQTITVDQQKSHDMYKYVEDAAIYAQPGDKISVKPHYSGQNMHAYLYLDLQNNGRFDIPKQVNSVPGANLDLVSYSYLSGLNSNGDWATSDSIVLPSFRVPEGLDPGAYRMRLKIDWNSAKPEASAYGSKFLASGSYTDFMLFVGDSVATVSDIQLNGAVLGEWGQSLANTRVKAFSPLTVKMCPANGFKSGGLKVTSGFDISSKSNKDRHGNVKYLTSEFQFDTEYFTIPAQYVVGNVLIEGEMLEDKPEVNGPAAVDGVNGGYGSHNGLRLRVIVGGVVIQSAQPGDVRICDAAGSVLFSRRAFKGEEFVGLQPGVYLVNDKKVIVK